MDDQRTDDCERRKEDHEKKRGQEHELHEHRDTGQHSSDQLSGDDRDLRPPVRRPP